MTMLMIIGILSLVTITSDIIHTMAEDRLSDDSRYQDILDRVNATPWDGETNGEGVES